MYFTVYILNIFSCMLLQLIWIKQKCTDDYRPEESGAEHTCRPMILFRLCTCTHTHIPTSLLLIRWYEIMALYYIKSILTDFSAYRQDRARRKKNGYFPVRLTVRRGGGGQPPWP